MPGPPEGSHLGPTRCRITVRGHVTGRLESSFAGLDLEPGIEQPTLVGGIRDQSRLRGVLDLLRGLCLVLVSVETNWQTSEPGIQESPEPWSVRKSRSSSERTVALVSR